MPTRDTFSSENSSARGLRFGVAPPLLSSRLEESLPDPRRCLHRSRSHARRSHAPTPPPSYAARLLRLDGIRLARHLLIKACDCWEAASPFFLPPSPPPSPLSSPPPPAPSKSPPASRQANAQKGWVRRRGKRGGKGTEGTEEERGGTRRRGGRNRGKEREGGESEKRFASVVAHTCCQWSPILRSSSGGESKSAEGRDSSSTTSASESDMGGRGGGVGGVGG